MIEMQFHHTGIAVTSIDEVLPSYVSVFGKQSVSSKIHISSQQVWVCFIEVSSGIFLELVEASSENSPITKMAKKGISYYHTAYLVSDIEVKVKALEALDYKPFEYFCSEAFANKRCIFLYTPNGHLIELIEK
ncbi:MAG: VOC family protein [Bacteroidia bacterium]|nr:VOC family protein [Bacteroidia bacterium]